MAAVWYRVEDYLTASAYDEYDQPSGRGTPRARLRTFHVLRETAKGVWLVEFWGTQPPPPPGRTVAEHNAAYMVPAKWVLRDAGRRFACPTLEEALVSFEARKVKQASIYLHRIEAAAESVRLARAGRWGG